MLQDRYTESVNQRESLKQEKITTGLRLQRAAVLIDALANEEVQSFGLVRENVEIPHLDLDQSVFFQL